VDLVQEALGLAAVLVEGVGVVGLVRAGRVLVLQVDVVVLDDRLGGQQVVGLVARVLRAAEGVEPDRRGVDGEQQQSECDGAAHPPHHASWTAPRRRPG